MRRYLREGLKAAVRQPFVVLTLFLYRFAWGFAIYRLVQSVVVPLLHRYPGSGLSATQTDLFWAEGQFQLMKTDISARYLWLFAGLLALRMALTPLLNAGVYFSLVHPEYNAGYRFFRGIRRHAGSFALLYALQTALTLAPLLWLLPIVKRALAGAQNYMSLATELAPYAAAAFAYGCVLHLLFMYVQIGRVSGRRTLLSLYTLVASFLSAAGISLLLLLCLLLFTGLTLTVSIIWAGFWAILLDQVYRFVRTLLDIWGLASQQRLFAGKTGG